MLYYNIHIWGKDRRLEGANLPPCPISTGEADFVECFCCSHFIRKNGGGQGGGRFDGSFIDGFVGGKEEEVVMKG